MNGFVHGVEFVNGVAYYKFILIVWDVMALVAMFFMFKSIKKRIRNKKVQLALATAGAEDTVDMSTKDDPPPKQNE